MKKILIMAFVVISLLIAASSWAVVVTGTGATKEEAINNGLREAVEMYTGALVYGVTDVKNYQFQKDKIVASSLGYIQNYYVTKISEIDDLIIVTLHVTVSENKIEDIVRKNVELVTYEDVLKDFVNVEKRQEQIRKLTKMLEILASRPVHEKYYIVYEGYRIRRIGAQNIDVILNTRIMLNPFYSRAYNEILKNISEPEDSADTWVLGGRYRLEAGRLINTRYYIPKDAKTPTVDEIHACINVNGVPVDKCREFRDNLMVVYSSTEIIKALIFAAPKAFKQAYDKEKITIDKKWQNAAIKKSKVIPAEGLPMKVDYRISNSEDVKNLKNLKIDLVVCKKN
jgi:hypothetical protein